MSTSFLFPPSDMNANHFHSSHYLTIKPKSELRLNGMITPANMDFWIFHFDLYDRAWPFIKYNFILWTSFFLQIFDFKTWKTKTPSYKLYWDNHFLQKFSPPSFQSMLLGLQLKLIIFCGWLQDIIFVVCERSP